MSVDMTHEELRAALAAEALGALDGAEREALRAHLATCDECRAELDSLRDAAALLAHTAPHAALAPARSDRLRARLVARAAADRDDAKPAPAVIPLEPRRRSALPAWLAAAAALLLAVGLGTWALSLRDRVRSLEEQTAALGQERGQLAVELKDRDAALAALSGPGVKVIDLASTQQRAPSGRMFWNPAKRRYTFFAYNLPQARAGREYQLWLITPAGPVAAPTFRVAGNGVGQVEGGYDIPNEQIVAVAVTEEPAGGLPKPSGEVLIVGNAATE